MMKPAATQMIILPATERRSRRKGMGETAGIRQTPPSLGARQLFLCSMVQMNHQPYTATRKPRGN
jgi:hypothetical protein